MPLFLYPIRRRIQSRIQSFVSDTANRTLLMYHSVFPLYFAIFYLISTIVRLPKIHFHYRGFSCILRYVSTVIRQFCAENYCCCLQGFCWLRRMYPGHKKRTQFSPYIALHSARIWRLQQNLNCDGQVFGMNVRVVTCLVIFSPLHFRWLRSAGK